MFKRKKRSHLLYLFLFGGSLLFLINRFVVSISNVSDYIYASLTYPVLLSQRYIVFPITDFFKKKKNQQDLEEMIFNLHKEKERLLEENIQLRATAFFYDQIKEILEFKKRYECNNVQISQIIFKHLNRNTHFFYVDKGTAHGIEPDMVAVYKNFLLGKVVTVYPYYSKIILITDKSCKIAAYCQNTKANGIHVGNNRVEYSTLNRVSHLLFVKVGDMIVSSGDGLIFPQGFAIGYISAIQKGDLYFSITVKPLFDVQDISYCFLLKKGAYKIG